MWNTTVQQSPQKDVQRSKDKGCPRFWSIGLPASFLRLRGTESTVTWKTWKRKDGASEHRTHEAAFPVADAGQQWLSRFDPTFVAASTRSTYVELCWNLSRLHFLKECYKHRIDVYKILQT